MREYPILPPYDCKRVFTQPFINKYAFKGSFIHNINSHHSRYLTFFSFQHIDLTSVSADSRMSEDSVKDGTTGVGIYSLSVSNVTLEHAGIYACIAIASFVDLDKTIKFRTARVTVREAGGK